MDHAQNRAAVSMVRGVGVVPHTTPFKTGITECSLKPCWLHKRYTYRLCTYVQHAGSTCGRYTIQAGVPQQAGVDVVSAEERKADRSPDWREFAYCTTLLYVQSWFSCRVPLLSPPPGAHNLLRVPISVLHRCTIYMRCVFLAKANTPPFLLIFF